ncbi:MAG: ABC transporter permease [Vicinamibacterales bacterium]
MTRLPMAANVSGAILVVVAVAAACAPWLAPYEPSDIVSRSLAAPSADHLLGTDRLGRDLLSRVLHGARLSLGGAALALACIVALGLTLGSIAGFYGRSLDTVIMRVVDAVLAIPTLVLAMAIAGLFPAGLLTVVAALTAVWWARYARVTRALVLSWRERQFVEAARALGAGDLHIMVRHVLPHILAPIFALSALEFGTLILGVSGLSFLGLGAQPPSPEWGTMINDAKSVFLVAPHALLAPALAITVVVLAFNVAGEHLGQSLGPYRSLLVPDIAAANAAFRGGGQGRDRRVA